jgi:uncharacterized protein YyaL (SSP411 family)
MSSTLLEKVLEGQFKTFLQQKDDEPIFKIHHATTKQNNLPFFEDYIFFAQLQLRVYEISGNEVFKENAIKTSEFIQKQFIEEEVCLTRAKNFNEHALYPNQHVSFFDASFRSPAASYISLCRRLAVLEADNNYISEIGPLQEEMTHQILKNPINAGEALRALTYPGMAYRVVKVPLDWAQRGEFTSFIPYFLSRFVLRYEKEQESRWQICTLESCELTGEGLEEFIQALTPKQEEKEE